MECPKCESKAICAEKKTKRHKAGEPVTEYRTYVCTNWQCLHGFVYRNTHMHEAERLDTARFLKRYEQSKGEYDPDQSEIFEEQNDE